MSVRGFAASFATALLAVSLTACGEPVKDVTVVLTDVRDAFVLSGSSQRPARDGEKLAKNDVVRTRAGGTAALVVRERKVVLGGDTDVTVPDGATVQLDRGALLVDRREGPAVTVLAGDTTIDEVGNGALRVEKSLSVLVAGLSAGARVRTVTGAQLALEPLYQVVASGRSLPRTALPLQLRADAWERSVIGDVVADDERLNDLARGLDTPGAGATVLPATYRGIARPSDLVLADAIGRAAARDEPGRRSAASRARLLRGEGGSWGVVARLLDTTAVDVGSALGEVLRGVPATSPDPVPSATVAPGGTVADGTPQPGVPTRPDPDSPQPPPPPSSTRPPTNNPTPTPTSPSPTPGAIEELVSAIPTPPPLLPGLGGR